jgi:uncharacterized protein with GYD domain
MEEQMTVYIVQGRYTQQALAGMVQKPEDREAEVRRLMERAGGKLLNFYLTFGEFDFLIVSDLPDPVAALSALAIAGAGGSVSDLRTTVGLTGAEAMRGFEMAGKGAAQFRSAGT